MSLTKAGIAAVVLAGALGFCAPAPATPPPTPPLDNGTLLISGQQLDRYGISEPLYAINTKGSYGVEDGEAGVGFTVAIERDGADADVWGAATPPRGGQSFPVVDTEPVRGAGTAEDPLVQRRTMRAGSALEVVEELSTVRDSLSFEARWTVRNVSAAPVNFRATAIGNFGDPHTGDADELGSQAIAETGSLRRLGSEIPDGPQPPEYQFQSHCSFCADGVSPQTLGLGGVMEELPSSRWSHAELADARAVLERVRADATMSDTYASGYLDAAAGAQWDRYVLGQPALAPGAGATFSVRYRQFNELALDMSGPNAPNCTVTAHMTTAFARGGARARVPLILEHDVNLTQEWLSTDATGAARFELPRILRDPGIWPPDQWGQWWVTLDRNGNGKRDPGELYRAAWSLHYMPAPCPEAAPAPERARTAPARARPALKLLRATRHGRRVLIRGRIARGAIGRVRLTWSGKRRARIARAVQVRPRRGAIRVTLRLSQRAARARRQRVTLTYLGSKTYLPAKVARRVR